MFRLLSWCSWQFDEEERTRGRRRVWFVPPPRSAQHHHPAAPPSVRKHFQAPAMILPRPRLNVWKNASLSNSLWTLNDVCCMTLSGSYDEVLFQSAQDLQPKHLVNFLLKLRWGARCFFVCLFVTPYTEQARLGRIHHPLFSFSHLISSAHRDLPVKGSSLTLAKVASLCSLFSKHSIVQPFHFHSSWNTFVED